MNVYGYQAFVQDYVFLEELGRRASEWGRDIQKRKLGTNDGGNQVSFAPGTKGGSKDGRNVGKNYHRQHRHHHARTKREILKERLEEDYEIEMLLLPEGMERRKVNQSTWDAKTSKVYLTAQYRFHRKFPSPSSQMTTTPSKSRINAVKDDSKTAQTEDESPIPILTHRNELDRSIHETLKRSIRERRPKKADSVPNWVTKMWDKMLEADIQSTVQKQRSHGDSLESPVAAKRTYCVLLATEASSAVAPFAQKRKTPRRKYIEVEMGDTFASVLKQKTFAEFPVFEVVPFGDYSDLLERDAMDEEEAAEVFDIFSYGNDQTDEGSSQGGEEETESNDEVGEPKRKRRKVDEEAGKRLFDGLMDYGDGTDSNASEMGEDGGLDIKRQKSAGSVQPEGGKGAGGLLGSLDYSSDESSSESEGEESKGHVMPEGGHPKPVEERYTLTTGEADGELEVDWD
ncbi:hypothetical protein FRB91_009812 [Serendipita sp. 411]|nr:hypothetical protein FRB91_009812 [Serendipita sp. 411]